MTTRKDVEGTLARWFAVDALGHVGVFTGPYAAWPAAVFGDYSLVEAADEHLDEAPSSTEAVLTVRGQQHAPGRAPSALLDAPTTPSFAELEASRGLFSFDAGPGYGASTTYYLEAAPRVPLLLGNAHPILRRAAVLVTLADVRFSLVDSIDFAEVAGFVLSAG